MDRLGSGRLCTPDALPASLASLMKPIVKSGTLGDEFVLLLRPLSALTCLLASCKFFVCDFVEHSMECRTFC